MLNLDTAQTAARRKRRSTALGHLTTCSQCGEDRAPSLCLELHHVAGRSNDPDLVVRLCLNCHAAQTEAHRAAGLSMQAPASDLDRLVGTLAGQAELHASLAATLSGWAQWIGHLVPILDERDPVWREALTDLPAPRSLMVWEES